MSALARELHCARNATRNIRNKLLSRSVFICASVEILVGKGDFEIPSSDRLHFEHIVNSFWFPENKHRSRDPVFRKGSPVS